MRPLRALWHWLRDDRLVAVDVTPGGVTIRVPRYQRRTYSEQEPGARRLFLATVDERAAAPRIGKGGDGEGRLQ